jgi:hypothetical protein
MDAEQQPQPQPLPGQASAINPFSFNPSLLLADLSNAVRFLLV